MLRWKVINSNGCITTDKIMTGALNFVNSFNLELDLLLFIFVTFLYAKFLFFSLFIYDFILR